MDVIKKISEIKLVPVVTFNYLEEVEPLLNTLMEADVPVAEICFRTEVAKEAIKLAVSKFKDMLIGAGTVINKTQCVDAIKLGVKFIVSPGLSIEVYEVCKKHNVPYFPGVVTPSEIMKALDLGLTNLKFFPADLFGGLKAIKTYSAVFPQVKFMPTGGISNQNLNEFISHPHIYACGGSWLVKGSLEDIKKTCMDARKIVKGEH